MLLESNDIFSFFSLSFSSNHSICSPCGFLPLLSHSVCERGQGWQSFNLGSGGWGNQGRCDSSLVYCDTASVDLESVDFGAECVQKRIGGLLGRLRGGEARASGSPESLHCPWV